VFPWHGNENYLWTAYKEVLKRAELPTDKDSGFHRMRKSVASHVDANGGDAQRALGHANRRTTEGSLDPTITKPPQPIDYLPDVIRPA